VTFLQPQRYTESAIKQSLLLGHSSLDLAPHSAGLFIGGLASGAESPGIRLAAKARRERFRPATHPKAKPSGHLHPSPADTSVTGSAIASQESATRLRGSMT